MALPVLDATFASAADLPRRQMLAKWLVNLQYSGSIEDYYTLPEKYIYAKIAVASGASRSEYDYTSLPDRYTLSDIYKAVSGSSADTIDRGEKEALGWIAAAVRGDASDPAKVATYINLPWRYQVASIITALAVDADAQSFITTSGATDVEAIDKFVKGVKALDLYNSMVCWPLRSTQNSGTGTTAFSLGGLGTFNGTLISGPAWTANGLTFDATNENVQLPDNANLYNARSGMVAFKTTNSAENQQLIEFQSTLSVADWYYLFRFQGNVGAGASGVRLSMTRNGTSSVSDNTGRTINLTDFQSAAFTMDDTTDNIFRNGAIEVGGARTGLSAINPTGARNIRLIFGSSNATTGAFAMTSTTKWSNTQVAALHSLYRTTLGTGLSLP